ncbi:MAG: hypothetical protein J07HN4v3_03264 [Halonotius sp. J07HN4]|nr:MAG: hypothetical protein J07HN4v3_03264 [Halonotius sp. J07HN4]
MPIFRSARRQSSSVATGEKQGIDHAVCTMNRVEKEPPQSVVKLFNLRALG